MFLAQLKRHEGERLTAYLDTRGVLTVGVGHNCKTAPVPGVNAPGDKISQETCDRLFLDDVHSHTAPLTDRLPWVKSLPAPRQAVFCNMAFNLGVSGLLKFKTTLALASAGHFGEASRQMLNSLWAKQVGRRAVELAEQLRTGKWQKIY